MKVLLDTHAFLWWISEALQEFAGCNCQALLAPPTRNSLTTQKRSVIPTNTHIFAAFRAA